MSYLLSVVIPTKNRGYYCLEAVKQILALNYPEVQICIQDNSDTDQLSQEIVELASPNVVYNYHPGVLSFVDNFDEAVSLAKGEYICMIGDDDGILPNILEVVHLMQKEGYDAIIPDVTISYLWPSESKTGRLYIEKLPPKNELIDTRKALSQLMANGGQGYLNCGMAKLYHGIVKYSRLQAIKEKIGKYFDGLSPDIYMSVLLSLNCSKVLKLHYPCTLPGICAKSGTADSSTGKHTGELRDAPHFAGHKDYRWDSKVPYVYSVETIWADTALHALRDIGDLSLYNKFRIDALDSACYYKYKQFRPRLLTHAKKYGYSSIFIIMRSWKFIFKNIYDRVLNKGMAVIGKPKSTMVYNIEDIQAAVDYVNNYLK